MVEYSGNRSVLEPAVDHALGIYNFIGYNSIGDETEILRPKYELSTDESGHYWITKGKAQWTGRVIILLVSRF